ncbi:MAG: hypothetical protein SCK70_06770, partial [bacterium]|nr:hypothetical protein [bacterium]
MQKTTIFFNSLMFLLFSVSFSYAQQDYQKWLEDQQKQFQEFKDARDKAFVEFLKKEWQAFQLFQGMVPDKTPKPAGIPKTALNDNIKAITPVPANVITEVRIPKAPLQKTAEFFDWLKPTAKPKQEELKFSFFDREIQLVYESKIKNIQLKKPIDGEQISNFWSEMSSTDYENLLDQTKQLQQKMKLNDWGYCLLLQRIGSNIYQQRENETNIFVWYLLTKSGYDSKVGYDKNQVYLLLTARNIIYGAPFFETDQKKYYLITFEKEKINANQIYTYEGNYPRADELISLNVDNVPVINQLIEARELKFDYFGEAHRIKLKIKKDVINFFENYPQTDYEIYFSASLSEEANYSLVTQFKPIIEGKTEVEAVNILLRFVQLAFEYQTDEYQFNREKIFFAEETLFYPFSDCEDRSILFAYLVRELLGLKVIGLDYPGHIATAVKFSTP